MKGGAGPESNPAHLPGDKPQHFPPPSFVKQHQYLPSHRLLVFLRLSSIHKAAKLGAEGSAQSMNAASVSDHLAPKALVSILVSF